MCICHIRGPAAGGRRPTVGVIGGWGVGWGGVEAVVDYMTLGTDFLFNTMTSANQSETQIAYHDDQPVRNQSYVSYKISNKIDNSVTKLDRPFAPDAGAES